MRLGLLGALLVIVPSLAQTTFAQTTLAPSTPSQIDIRWTFNLLSPSGRYIFAPRGINQGQPIVASLNILYEQVSEISFFTYGNDVAAESEAVGTGGDRPRFFTSSAGSDLNTQITVNGDKILAGTSNLPGVYYFQVNIKGRDEPLKSPLFGVSPSVAADGSDIDNGFNGSILVLLTPTDPSAATTTTNTPDLTGLPSRPTGTSGNGESDDEDDDSTEAVSDAGNGGGGRGGLPVGAIVGIAIGGVVALGLILGLVWFFMRRRKRAASSQNVEASTPLAASYPNGGVGRSGDFMAEKDTGAMVAESPHSQMYTDRLERSSQGAIATGSAVAGTSASGAYVENAERPYGSPVQAPAMPEESSRADMSSPVPSATVARHLVEENMTAEDIRRLEEEERELDRQIQEAGRRK